MLLRITRRYLPPYQGPLTIIIVLQLVGTIASLYLPSLNADIIDRGVATGDTGMQTGRESIGHTVGFELFDMYDVEELARHAANRAPTKLHARPAPSAPLPVCTGSAGSGVFLPGASCTDVWPEFAGWAAAVSGGGHGDGGGGWAGCGGRGRRHRASERLGARWACWCLRVRSRRRR